jgi:hypothetical protein
VQLACDRDERLELAELHGRSVATTALPFRPIGVADE